MTSVFEDSASAYSVAAVFSFGAVVVVAAAMLRSRVRPPAAVALLLSFLFKGIAVTLATPPLYEKFDNLVGVHNMGRLVLNLSGGMAWTPHASSRSSPSGVNPGPGRCSAHGYGSAWR